MRKYIFWLKVKWVSTIKSRLLWPHISQFRARRALSILKDILLGTRRVLSILKDVLLRTRRVLSILKDVLLRTRRVLSIHKDVLLRTRRVLSILQDVLLRTRRALSLYKVYGDSALFVLNRTSLNCDSTLLALNWRYADKQELLSWGRGG